MARKFLRKPKNAFYAELLKKRIIAAMMEQERAKLEFLPKEGDDDPLLDIEYDNAAAGKLASLDEMNESGWVAKRPKKAKETKETSSAAEPDLAEVETEDITEGDD